MKQINDNVCLYCGGSGHERSGAEYMGAHEMVCCDWCCGTGFQDIDLGVERLRSEITKLKTREILLIEREGAIQALENVHDDRALTDDEREVAWLCLKSVMGLPTARKVDE